MAEDDVRLARQAVEVALAEVKRCGETIASISQDIKELDRDMMKMVKTSGFTGEESQFVSLSKLRDKASAELKEANERLDKANERLDKARAELKEANERLDKANERLVQLTELQFSQMELTRPVQAADERNNTLQELVEIIKTRIPDPNAPVSYSNAALGQLVMGRRKDMVEKVPPAEGAPILTEDEQWAINQYKLEKHLVGEMTKHFNRILPHSGYHLVFVNSEDFGWLQQHPNVSRKTDMKPDGFVTFQGLFCHRETQGRPAGYKFGIPFAKLLDSIIIFEAKLEIDDAAVGEVEKYVERLPPGSQAVLFDQTEFWLIYTFNTRAEPGSSARNGTNHIQNIRKMAWIDKGSERVFLDFIVGALNDWTRLLQSACDLFKVQLPDTDAFLGAGANGRVFKVLREDKSSAALKIITKNVALLVHESQMMKNAAGTGVVATVLEDYKLLDQGKGAGMLIREIGEPISRQSLTESTVVTIFRNLFTLHCSGLQHGDPRLPNLIQVDGKILWIDMMYSISNTDLIWKHDAITLSKSILGLSENADLPSDISSLISQYDFQRNEQSCQALARKLWASLSTTDRVR